MQLKLMVRLVSIWLLALLMTPALFAQEKKSTKDMSEQQILEFERKAHKLPSGPSLYIAPIQGTKDFSVLLTDANNASISNILNPHQLEVLEGLLQAAKEFAQTEEAVGAAKPVITRLMDKDEPSLIVDVAKTGTRSRVYVTLVGIRGRLTADAGEVIRGKKEQQNPVFLKMLFQVHEARANNTPPQ